MEEKEIKYWMPSEGDKVSWTFDEITKWYGLEIARGCRWCKEKNEKYSKRLIRDMYNVKGGRIKKVETEEDKGALTEEKKEVDEDTRVRRRVAAHKGAETRKKNREARSIPVEGSAAGRAYAALGAEMEANSILSQNITVAVGDINPIEAYDVRIKESVSINISLINKIENPPEEVNGMGSCLNSPMTLMMYFMQHRPYYHKQKKYWGNEHKIYKERGLICINKTRGDMADDLNTPLPTIDNWIKRMKDERLVFRRKINKKNLIVIGYIDDNTEVYFYNLLFNRRVCPN